MTDKEKTPQAGFYFDYDENGDSIMFYRDPEGRRTDLKTESDFSKLPEEAQAIYRDTVGKSLKKAVAAFMRNVPALDLETLKEASANLRPALDLIDEIEELEPFLSAELKKPEYGGKTIKEIKDSCTPGELLALRRDPNSFYTKAVEAARAAKAAALPVIEISKTDLIHSPTDRFNFFAFNDFRETGGQFAYFNMMSERDKRDPARRELDITMTYSLTFDDDPRIKTTKVLDHIDRRLLQAIDSLFVQGGQNIFSIGDISEAMGGSRNPSDNRRKMINNRLTKLGTARIYLDNEKEAAAYNYDHIVIDDIILNFTRIRVKHHDNGQETTAIKGNSRPAPMLFAAARNQMSVVPLKVIQSKISQTDKSLRIEDYLLYRILRQKNEISKLKGQQEKKYTQSRQKQIRDKSNLIILLETFHEQVGVKDKKKKDRDRADETARKYLTHYKKVAFIEEFKTTKEKIIIKLPI